MLRQDQISFHAVLETSNSRASSPGLAYARPEPFIIYDQAMVINGNLRNEGPCTPRITIIPLGEAQVLLRKRPELPRTKNANILAGNNHRDPMRLRRTLSTLLFLILSIGLLPAQTATGSTAAFEPLEHWRQAVLAGDSAALQAMYSAQPPVNISGPGSQNLGLDEELRFWEDHQAARLTSLTFDDLDITPGENGATQLIFQAVMTLQPPSGTARTWYVRVAQFWQKQKAGWRMVKVFRGDMSRLEQPMHTHMHMMHHSFYPADADAHAELSHALAEATRQRKRVLVVFGAGWSYDCQVLDLAFHRPDVYPLMEKHYVVLHVDTGSADKNVDLAERFQVPLEKGIPALAVLKSDGVLLFSQQNGEFKSARDLAPEDLEAFLEKWKGTP